MTNNLPGEGNLEQFGFFRVKIHIRKEGKKIKMNKEKAG